MSLPDLTAFAEVMEFEFRLTYRVSLMLMTQQSLDTLSERAPNSAFDQRRFRANLLLEVEGTSEPFPEQAWIGKELHRRGRAQNCRHLSALMTTHATGDLPRDTDVAHLVSKQRVIWVYAKVISGGSIVANQTVEVK